MILIGVQMYIINNYLVIIPNVITIILVIINNVIINNLVSIKNKVIKRNVLCGLYKL